MKTALLVLIGLMTVQVYGQHLVVLGREDACDMDSTPCQPKSDKEKTLIAAYRNAITSGLTGKTEVSFQTPPLQWGRKVRDDDFGGLAYLTSFTGGLVTDLVLTNLTPRHAYRLCLNGRPDLAGNNLLPTPVPGHAEEKYYDFLTVTTDDRGNYHANLAVLITPGDYHVRFYVKDSDDFKIILYHDYFKFTVH